VQLPYESRYQGLLTLWDIIMKDINLALFLGFGKVLERAAFGVIYPQLSSPSEFLIPPEMKESWVGILSDWENDCRDLDLVASLATIKRLQKLLSEPAPKLKDFAELSEQLYGRLGDEALQRRCLSLSLQEAETYDRWWKEWEKILARFEETSRDVEEMNKCFALGRYTASMFHALHVAEWGAIKLGEYIGVTDLKKGWGPTKKKLGELVKAGHSALPAHLAGNFEFLEQVSREIDSMVLAWRHKVDHAVNHLAIVPNTEFTPDISRHILGAVRIFMLRLTEGMP
jgi:hypothetical protein